jgi:hypothetical protein
LMTRSNLSAGPIAAPAGFISPCDITAAAADDPVNLKKLRLETADMLPLP